MITVNVKIFGKLRDQFPELELGKTMAVKLTDGTSVGILMAQLNIPDNKQVFVNGCRQKPTHGLADGDSVGIIPPTAGG